MLLNLHWHGSTACGFLDLFWLWGDPGHYDLLVLFCVKPSVFSPNLLPQKESCHVVMSSDVESPIPHPILFFDREQAIFFRVRFWFFPLPVQFNQDFCS